MLERYLFNKAFYVFLLLLVMFGLLNLGSTIKNPISKNNFFGLATLWQAPEGQNVEETAQPVQTEVQATEPTKSNPMYIALCLKGSGAKMYGTYWSEHTSKQKETFGEYFKYVPYIECENGIELSEECKEVNVSEYPLWVINSKKLKGEQTLDQLGKAAGC